VAEVELKHRRVQELGSEEGMKVAQNVAAGARPIRPDLVVLNGLARPGKARG
jgi:hypothetical protein